MIQVFLKLIRFHSFFMHRNQLCNRPIIRTITTLNSKLEERPIKYNFIIKLNNMTVSSRLSKGKEIKEGMRISNGAANFDTNFNNIPFRESFGHVEYLSFKDSVYIYEIGNLENIQNRLGFKLDEIQLVNFLLRKVEVFLTCLWLVKDNSITSEVGFLHMYEKYPEEGIFTSNVIPNLPSTSDGEFKNTEFDADELTQAIKYYNEFEFNPKSSQADIITQLENPLIKGSNRIDRAFYFLGNARNTTALPIKSLNYCSLLECLFTNDSGEISHKVSERFALYIGNDFEARKALFKLSKELYKIRSKATHGQPVGAQPDHMRRLLIEIDNRVRNILLTSINKETRSEVFEMQNERFDNWFLDLVLR